MNEKWETLFTLCDIKLLVMYKTFWNVIPPLNFRELLFSMVRMIFAESKTYIVEAGARKNALKSNKNKHHWNFLYLKSEPVWQSYNKRNKDIYICNRIFHICHFIFYVKRAAIKIYKYYLNVIHITMYLTYINYLINLAYLLFAVIFIKSLKLTS